MSEKEKDAHRVSPLIHPAVTMALMMAQRLHADRVEWISASEFKDLFRSVTANEAWREHGINLRTAALMVATALQLRAVSDQADSLATGHNFPDAGAAQASEHAHKVMGAVAALSALADQFGGANRA